jgi:nucleotide-binding universal stress UspA family protein
MEASMFTTIVVGVDGREGGRDALSLGGRLALLNGGELIAVRVLPFDYYVSRAGAPPYASLAEQDAKREVEQELADAGVAATIRILGDSSPARALHRVAEEAKADVIVVGSTHHGAIGRVLAGDDAAGTLHGSPCPVAVAPRGLAGRDWPHVSRIGVGFDGGPEATQALALAARLARDSGASLAVRAVVASPVNAVDFSAYDTDWLESSKQVAADELAKALSGLDVEATSDVAVGLAVDELVELSKGVDLLVLGSRGWGPVRRTMAGSAAAGVIRKAHAPVLVLPRGAATGQPGERSLEPSKTAATA